MQTTVHQSQTKSEEKRLRKKLQNRLNQRAHRNRLQENNQHHLGKHDYQIRRWRIDSNDPYHSETRIDVTPFLQTEEPKTPSSDSDTLSALVTIPSASAKSYPKPPPFADQLLHLIQYNAFRGLHKNKIILGQTSISLSPGRHPERFDESFPTFSVVLPRASDVVVPGNLTPTESQMSLIHSTWINTLPFPAMRDNLIKLEGSFNHAEFAVDVMGYVMDLILFPQPEGSGFMDQDLDQMGWSEESYEDDDEVTANRTGLIVWGEPYKMDSWEATPGFLRKYAWAMHGCDELIESSNRWRRIRGEEPLRFFM